MAWELGALCRKSQEGIGGDGSGAEQAAPDAGEGLLVGVAAGQKLAKGTEVETELGSESDAGDSWTREDLGIVGADEEVQRPVLVLWWWKIREVASDGIEPSLDIRRQSQSGEVDGSGEGVRRESADSDAASVEGVEVHVDNAAVDENALAGVGGGRRDCDAAKRLELQLIRQVAADVGVGRAWIDEGEGGKSVRRVRLGDGYL